MQKDYDAIRALNAEVIAISSDNQEKTKQTVNRTKAGFPVLADVEMTVIAAYNATDPLNRGLARPITYIIDESGVIRWKFLDIRVGDRIDTAKLIEVLRAL